MDNYIRDGFVLSSHRVLKRESKLIDLISNEKNITRNKRKNIDDIQESILETDKFNFINLKDELSIFINNEPYVLREKDKPSQPLKEIIGISGENLEINEGRLIREIYLEYNKNGYISVVDASEENIIVNLDSISLKTTYEFIWNKLSEVNYMRLPLSSYGTGMENKTIDKVLELLQIFDNRTKIVLYSDENGDKNNFCYFLILLHQKITNFNLNSLDSSFFIPLKTNEDPLFMEFLKKYNQIYGKDISSLLTLGYKGKYRIISNLLTILQNQNSKKIVDTILLPHDNIKLEILDHIINGEKNGVLKANILLIRYIMLILVAEYLLCNRSAQEKLIFYNFIDKRYEYQNLFRYIETKKENIDLLAPLNLIIEKKSLPEIKTVKHVNGILARIHKTKHITNLHKGSKIIINTDPSNISCINENIIFFNMREEPLIYIEDYLYTLRNFEKCNKNITFLRNLNKNKIEEIEGKLKKAIMNEIIERGEISYYVIKNNDHEKKEIIADINNIKTIEEYFLDKNINSTYIRIPITSSLSFRFNKFDKIYSYLQSNKIKNHVDQTIVIHSNSKRGRATYTAIIIYLIQNIDNIEISLKSTLNNETINLLITLIENGKKAFNIINHMFLLYFETDIKDFLLESKRLKIAKRTLKKYFLLICFASWLMTYRKKYFSFEKWILTRSDIINLLESINNMNLEAFQENRLQLNEEIMNRKGEILNSKMILKNDYFIGSRFFRLYDSVHGTQNFRFVLFEKGIIAGLSIPTEKGISNTLKKIRDVLQDDSSEINWFCLREEPVVYINNSPYVLRHMTAPDTNLEITGVSTEIVEIIENKIVNDIKKEKTIHLYDEILIGNTVENITRKVEVVSINSTYDIYSKFKINYTRIPVTDEKIPIPYVIDRLYEMFKKIQGTKITIFNCQMGKGRTTTGMILAYITFNHKNMIGIKYLPKFRLISLLVQVLPFSLKSKSIVDEVINIMSHLENLRDVISKCVDLNLHEKGKNFLLRYFYLICFCEFLLQNKEKTFSEFLLNRPEIVNLANQVDEIGLEIIK